MLVAFGRGGARRSDVAKSVVGQEVRGEVNRYTEEQLEVVECFFFSSYG